MKTLQIDEKQAKTLYKTAMPELKQMLEEAFGEDFFNVLAKVKTFADALAITGRPEVPPFSDVPEDLREFFKATYKVVVINEALNDGKRFDLYDSSVFRYYPWFKTKGSPSGFAFDVSGYVNTYAIAGSGSRLRVLSDEAATHIGKIFLEVWENVQLK